MEYVHPEPEEWEVCEEVSSFLKRDGLGLRMIGWQWYSVMNNFMVHNSIITSSTWVGKEFAAFYNSFITCLQVCGRIS